MLKPLIHWPMLLMVQLQQVHCLFVLLRATPAFVFLQHELVYTYYPPQPNAWRFKNRKRMLNIKKCGTDRKTIIWRTVQASLIGRTEQSYIIGNGAWLIIFVLIKISLGSIPYACFVSFQKQQHFVHLLAKQSNKRTGYKCN